MNRHRLPVLAFVLWAAAVLVGLGWMGRYAATAGDMHRPDADGLDWANAVRTPGRPLLVMAVHPRCPCTSASLSELDTLIRRRPADCDVVILEYSLEADATGRTTRELGGLTVPVIPDPAGRLAARLGAVTSGHAVLVGADGQVRFHGGLTIARGHRGPAPGQEAVLSALTGNPVPFTTTPVYGCKLGDATCTDETCHGGA